MAKIDDAAKEVSDQNINSTPLQDITRLTRDSQLKKTHALKKLEPILERREEFEM